MRTSVKILAAVGAVVVIVMVGVMLGWFGDKNQNGSLPHPSPQPAGIAPSHSTAGTSPRPATNPVVAIKPPTQPKASGVAPNPNIITNWEERLDTILGSEGEESEKAKQLLAIFSRLPEEGQVEVVQHLSNLVADQDYAPLGKLLVDASLPEDVLEQLMADILNRPNSLKLPLLLEVARNP